MKTATHALHYTVFDRIGAYLGRFPLKVESTGLTPDDVEWLAERAAEDFHAHHGGQVQAWPLTFVVANGAKRLGSAIVARTLVATFTVTAKALDGPPVWR